MAKLHEQWIVLPHGPVTELAPGLLTVTGEIPMPLGNFPRRMTAFAIGRGRSLIYSPMALDEEGMRAIEALGVPAFLIVPNRAHRLDLKAFRARYPNATVVTAPAARSAVEEAVNTLTTSADLGKRAELVLIAGTGEAELALLVRHDGGLTLVTNDVIGNVAHSKGPGAWIMSRLMGFGPSPRIPRVARRFFIKDPAALAKQFREWADFKGLVRLVPSHGDVIDRPADVLRRLADDLD